MELVDSFFTAIVVLYKCPITASKSLTTLNEAAAKASMKVAVKVYDNSPTAEENYEKKAKVFPWLSIVYFSDTSNKGISYAYNFAVDLAVKENFKWALFLDQDTTISSDYIADVSKAIKDNPDVRLFCPKIYLKNETIFSPCLYAFKRGFQVEEINEGLNSLRKYSPVNSGMMVSTSDFVRAGGYNEKVKLDFSDFQFIERFRRSHSDFFLLNTAFHQDFSNDETDPVILNNRYKSYCDSAANCEKRSFFDHLQYFIVVLCRAVMLTRRTRKLVFFKTFYTYYVRVYGYGVHGKF